MFFFSEVGQTLKDRIPISQLNPLELVTEIDEEMRLDPTNADELMQRINNLNNVGAGYDK